MMSEASFFTVPSVAKKTPEGWPAGLSGVLNVKSAFKSVLGLPAYPKLLSTE
jgi:hypothetical protein